MKFNLSVVNIISDDHKDAINQIAEAYGCGPNNLSVKLQGEDSIYWGCHSWWQLWQLWQCHGMDYGLCTGSHSLLCGTKLF